MMKKIYLSLFLFLGWTLSLAAAPIAVQNEADEIRALLESRDLEIKELLGPEGTEHTPEQREQLQLIINDIIDFESMAARALGKTWEEISPQEREEFVALFTDIIRDHSLSRLEIYRADVDYDEIHVEGESAEVKTTARLKNVRTSVDYSMAFLDGQWMITDMVIDGVSTVASYQRQFQSIIRSRGFATLLDSLRDRAART